MGAGGGVVLLRLFSQKVYIFVACHETLLNVFGILLSFCQRLIVHQRSLVS
jgi:hypothetical protein